MNQPDGRVSRRALKGVSMQQLETAIAAALFKITAEKYRVDIRRFDLNGYVTHGVRDGAVIELSAVAVEDMSKAAGSAAVTAATTTFAAPSAPCLVPVAMPW